MFKFVIVLAVLGVTLGLPANSSVIDLTPRILGGAETDIEHNPWQLALLYTSRHFCSAVEINPNWALTTAHCIEGVDRRHLTVRAGSTTKSFGGQIIDVLAIYEHPDYDKRTVDYDFALLQLAEPITVEPTSAVALPEPGQDVIPGITATITGWGVQNTDGLGAEILRVIQVPVVSHEVCQRIHQHNEITRRMFCAGDVQYGDRDTCFGDGGGSVIVQGRLVGLVSWGSQCGRANSLGVHARVSAALGWIYDTTGI